MAYVKMAECPVPVKGLKWTEMYSYFGEVIAMVNGRAVCKDTAKERRYILTVEEFQDKFSYGTIPGCWVRFEFPEMVSEES